VIKRGAKQSATSLAATQGHDCFGTPSSSGQQLGCFMRHLDPSFSVFCTNCARSCEAC
jgi:hypothetical protein